jgi:truncated hemoglobin YjbI
MVENFQLKARKHLFNCSLREFPAVLEMYMRSFNIVELAEDVHNHIIDIIRASANAETAFAQMCEYLDTIDTRES